MRKVSYNTPKLIVSLLTIILLSGGISIISSLYAQNKNKLDISNNKNFIRPKPQHQIKPYIPSVNRYQDDKVFLEKADSLFKPYTPEYLNDTLNSEKQIVKGGVVFRHGGMWMYCDSAYYFPQRNSLDAFGNVRMQQGDTLFVYSDKLFYDGYAKMAILVGGPSCKDVTLKDPQATLTTDSLNYDLGEDKGWYDSWGRLEDGQNELTSLYGEYSPTTKIATFRRNVVLENNEDNFRMYTDELEYNTATDIATINTKTKIVGENDTIYTTAGIYNTTTDNAVLTERSTIIHKDSSQNIITLEGDSIIYDKLTHISKAFKFRDINKNALPMVLTDTARKTTLIGGYGEYNDSTREAFSTEYPLLIEYSRPDTLFLRADTIATLIRTEMIWPDSLRHNYNSETRRRLQSYKTLQDVADAFTIELAKLPYKFPAPLVKANNIETNTEEDNEISEESNRIDTISGSESIVKIPAETSSKNVTNKETESVAEISSKIEENNNENGISAQPNEEMGSLIESDISPITDTDSTATDRSSIHDTIISSTRHRIDALGRDSINMIPKEFNVAKAIGRARVFNQDIQGIADTMIYQEFDSMLYLIHKPIVWSGERQVFGSKINILFNDSNVERAHLPESGFLAEHVDEDFYNQLSGKKMVAYFKDNELSHLYVDGNVETIFLPMENDSTYNRMVTAESSYLTIDMTSRKMDKIKMWPEVTGSVYPIFLVKKSQQYLSGFKWREYLRPKREWYGNGWKWIDELGEVPDELEKYFSEE